MTTSHPAPPEWADESIQRFAGANARYYIYKWKFARKWSQWNWAAFFLGPVWFMHRRMVFWALLTAAMLVAFDFYFTTNPYHFTVAIEVMLFSGLCGNPLYRRRYQRLRETLRREKAGEALRLARLEQAGGRRWDLPVYLLAGMAGTTLLLPGLFGINLYQTHVKAVLPGSIVLALARPETSSAELMLLRQDYELASLKGEFQRSISVNQGALKLAAFKLGPEDSLAIGLQAELITSQLSVGAWQEALRLTDELVKTYQSRFGQDHLFVAFMMNNRVSVELYQGLYDQARTDCNNCLLLMEKFQNAMKELHQPVLEANLAAIYSNMAVVQQEYCQFEDAEKNHQEALRLMIQATGGYSLQTCTYLERMGDCYREQLKTDEAGKFYQQAREIAQHSLGDDNPLMASVFLRLGENAILKRQYAEAESLLEHAHGLNQKYFGPSHTATAETAGQLGRVYFIQGKLSQSEMYLDRSLAMLERSVGKKNIWYAKALTQRADVYLFRNNTAAGERALMKSLEISMDIYGENNPRLLAPLEQLSELYEQTKKASNLRRVNEHIQTIRGGASETLPDPHDYRLSVDSVSL